jgi:hypothetical protein
VAFAAAILGNTDSTDPASQKPDRALARHPSRAHAHGCIGGGFHVAQPRSEAMGRFYSWNDAARDGLSACFRGQ